MSQHDYVIADQAGAAFLADLNSSLAAIVSQNSGATAPATTFAYQWWADTTTGILKQRNAANSAWITVCTLADWGLASVQAQASTAFTTGGTSTAFTLTPTPALTALATGQEFDVVFHTASGATPTLAVSGLTAKNIKYRDSTGAKQAVTSAQVPSGWRSKVVYDGTDYIVREVPATGYAGALDLSNAAAGQIKFPATQNASADANTLDDYEEGTWTPGDNSGGGLSFSNVTGAYVKIGRLVIAPFGLTFPSTADTNAIAIAGLPFSTANNNAARQGFISYTTESTAARLLVDAASTTFSVINSTGGTLTNAAMSTDNIFGVVVYYV